MSIVKAFEAIGAKVRVVSSGHRTGPRGFSIDIVREKGDEIFEIRQDPRASISVDVVDKRPSERHLLLMVKDESRNGVPKKEKFLCGHDEFHWFAAQVQPTVADVPRAKESLKPPEVVTVQSTGKKRKKVKGGVMRQGEWFFIPMPSMKAPANQILKDEPIRREGGGKPHIVEEVWRQGGDVAYDSGTGDALRPVEYRRLLRRSPEAARRFHPTRVNAKVFGRGKVRHPDHSTVVLSHWYQIVPNTENKFATRSMRFID